MNCIKKSLIASLVIVAGCADDESSSELKGVFVDSPVSGIKYKTETKSGTTNNLGEYFYLSGESVVFSIGGINFPSTLAKDIVTPLDLAATSDVNDIKVVNIVRLLISLDADNEPSNGIEISDTAHTIAENLTVSFESATFDSDVLNLVSNGGGGGVIVDSSTAIDHFSDTLSQLNDNDNLSSFISGNSFSVSGEGNEIDSLVFNSDGGGSLKWEVGEGESEDIVGIEWSVSSQGNLEFVEGGTYNWALTPTSVNLTEATFNYYVSGTENGEFVEASGTIVLAMQ